MRKLRFLLLTALACAVIGVAAGGSSAATAGGATDPVCDTCLPTPATTIREGGRTVGAGQVIEIVARMADSGTGSAAAQKALQRVAKLLQCLARSDGSDAGTDAAGASAAKASHDIAMNCIRNMKG